MARQWTARQYESINYETTQIKRGDTGRDLRCCGNIFKRNLPPELRSEVDDLLKRATILKIERTWNWASLYKPKRLGFIIYEFNFDVPIVHYIYISKCQRHLGLGSYLLQFALMELPFYYTYPTTIEVKGGVYKPAMFFKRSNT